MAIGPVGVASTPGFRNYTGRIGEPGTGTDSRASIQSALDAAVNLNGSSYYNYLNRRSETVRLRPGHYLVSAPSNGQPSLSVPAGVTFDASDATLYFDYPPAPTNDWCGIKIGQYANLLVGKLTPSGRNAPPDTVGVYDGARLVFTDNNSRVIGYKDSEIRGFQGAGVRGIGAWISYVQGIRFADIRYGYIASNLGDAYSYAYDSGGPGYPRRVHTDIWFEDCQFVNCSRAGFLGAVAGTAAAPNGADRADSGLSANFKSCVFENIGNYAINAVNVMNMSMIDCHLEEVGNGDGMINVDTVRMFSALNTQINLAGRSVPGPTGNVSPFPSAVFRAPSVQGFVIEGLYCHNTYQPNLALIDIEPAVSYRIGAIFTDAYSFTGGGLPVEQKGSQYLKGKWDQGHLVLGNLRLWVDSTGTLRSKVGVPTSETDGTAYLKG